MRHPAPAPGHALALSAPAALAQPTADARNLTGKRHVSDLVADARRLGSAVFYPGEGRSLYLGTRAPFVWPGSAGSTAPGPRRAEALGGEAHVGQIDGGSFRESVC